jgi:predicted NBD/HSP70 family sugar kinase
MAISSPGVVRPDGYVTGMAAVEFILETNYAKLIESKINKKVVIDNDANCSLISEL